MQTTGTFFSRLALIVRFWMIAGSLLLFFGCAGDEVCEEVTANNLRLGFYLYGLDDSSWTVIDSLRVFTPEDPDNPLYEHLGMVSVLELPLNLHADSCAFIIDFYHVKDTLWFNYKRETHFVSVECGFTMFFEITGVAYTTNHIQHVSENITYVTNSLDEHYKIYIPPAIGIN
ncbi:MAG: hypothetical protein EA394_06905 [Bacteroidia bacterium]|nr:MAG: hypothetical protein EA394_06905 [Bacteroidia bacterium]